MARLPNKSGVIRRLFANSGNVCAFPDCKQQLIDEDGEFVGQICHIEAAGDKGQRFNEKQNDEDRRSYDNLILLCYPHHIKTNNVLAYPPNVLREIKANHEKKFATAPFTLPVGIEEKLLSALSKTIENIQETLSSTNKQISELTEVSSNQYNHLVELIKSQGVNQIITATETNIYSEKLSFFNDLRKRGKTKTALEEILQFKKENWDKIDSELRYKVIANAASALFELGKKIDGAQILQELTTVDYKSEDSNSYLALSYALLGKTKEFDHLFNELREKGSKNINLWLAFLHCYADQMKPEELQKQIPVDVFSKPEIQFTLGELYLDDGNTRIGFEMLENSVNIDETSIAKRWVAQGIVVGKKLLHLNTVEKAAFRNFTEEELQLIQTCIAQLTEVWDYVSKTELANTSSYIIMNRGISYKILGNHTQAVKDLEAAWNLEPNFFTFKNLVAEYFDTAQLDRAKELIYNAEQEKLEHYVYVDDIALKIRYRILVKDDLDSICTFISAELQKVSTKDRLFLYDLILTALLDRGAYAKALPFANQMIQEFENEPAGYVLSATCYRLLDNTKKAIENISIAFVKAQEKGTVDWAWHFMGVEFLALDKYEEAIQCFEKIHRHGVIGIITGQLLLAYYHGGHYEKAEDLAKQILQKNAHDPTSSEVLFRIFDATARTDEAKAILEDFLASDKKFAHDHFRLFGIGFYKRAGDIENLKRLLLSIEDYSSYQLQQQFIFAKMLLECGEIQKGLDVAYEIRLNNYEDSRAHEYYLYALIGRPEEQKEEMFPSTVSMENSVIVIDQSGQANQYFLTDDKRLSGQTVLRNSDTLTKLVLGKNLGDEIELKNSIGSKNILKIDLILNKHTFAFRESRELLQTKFADKTGIIFFNGEGDIVDNMKNFIYSQSADYNRKKDEIFEMYNSGQLTIGMVDHFMGKKNFIETWLGMITSSDIGIQCYDHSETLELEWAIEHDAPVIMDITALLTMQVLLDKAELSNRFTQRIIAKSTLDELISYRDSLNQPQPMTSFGVINGQLTKHTISQEDIEQQKKWLDSLIEWCKINTKVMSPKKFVEKDTENANLWEVLGKITYDSIQLALEHKGILQSDDSKLKTLVLNEYQLRSFSTYQLITQSTRENIITPIEFADLTRALIKANYSIIPVSGEDLWTMLDESNFKIQLPFTNAVQGMLILNTEFAIKTLLTFAKHVYLNINVKEIRDQALQYVLRVFKQRGDYSSILPRVLRNLELEFKLLPMQKEDFKQLIRLV